MIVISPDVSKCVSYFSGILLNQTDKIKWCIDDNISNTTQLETEIEVGNHAVCSEKELKRKHTSGRENQKKN